MENTESERNVNMKELSYEKFAELCYNLDNEEEHTNYEMCKKCKDSCCTKYPCELFPEDIMSGNITYDVMIRLLETNLVCLDVGDESDKFYVRMKTVGESIRGNFVYEGWGGQCCALGEDGCKLKFKNRPFTGRFGFPCNHDLDPSFMSMTKSDLVEKWKPYVDIINKIVQKYGVTHHVEDNGESFMEYYIKKYINGVEDENTEEE